MILQRTTEKSCFTHRWRCLFIYLWNPHLCHSITKLNIFRLFWSSGDDLADSRRRSPKQQQQQQPEHPLSVVTRDYHLLKQHDHDGEQLVHTDGSLLFHTLIQFVDMKEEWNPNSKRICFAFLQNPVFTTRGSFTAVDTVSRVRN